MMKVGLRFQRSYRRLLNIIGVIVVLVGLIQLVFLYSSYASTLSHGAMGKVFVTSRSATLLSSPTLTGIDLVHKVVNSSMASDSEDGVGDEAELRDKENDHFLLDDNGELDTKSKITEERPSHKKITSGSTLELDKSLEMRNGVQTDGSSAPVKYAMEPGKNTTLNKPGKTKAFSYPGEEDYNQSGVGSSGGVSPIISTNGIANLVANSTTPLSSIRGNKSPTHDTKLMESQSKHTNKVLLPTVSSSSKFLLAGKSMKILNKRAYRPTSISNMTMFLIQSYDSSKLMKPQWSSPRDRELQLARLQIKNAPIITNSPELYASLFRNFSTFKRSYELMERMLKIYVYKEGEKPIFHQPMLRGIYASEGWFMKLMEGNKQFVVKDPRKAHLFYLPFSSQRLRSTVSPQDLEKYLKNYTQTVAKKYRFWNRAGGADHFLVACHDWAPKITRNSTGSSLRALCNANVARGFRVGKDVSLPVTYIRSAQDPQKDLGGIPPSERHILAFFAGGMHGYLRPILLQYWANKEPDMKIFGPMPRDIEGKMQYREYMKSSKYCICARGYEVHTPRVVEAIYYECVPVIISDNYAPPFFEVLNWESFSVFIFEEDIPNLRNILLAIPEEKYLAMQQRVKMVQQHFLWHKKPEKYDLFNMILHSVWYNRVFQVKV